MEVDSTLETLGMPNALKSQGMNSVAYQRAALIEKYGAWTALNIDLGDGVFTIDKNVTMAQTRHAQCVLQTIADTSGKPISKLRILDLACLEGLYSVELAAQGASVVGIEGREANIEKARFVQRALNLKNIEFIKDDVRNLSVGRLGKFDVVLCAGILYHLDAPDVFSFIEKIFEVTKEFALFDTHFALEGPEAFEYKGFRYSGMKYTEHAEGASQEQKDKDLHASLDNNFSVWLTKDSLFNFLGRTGFTSAMECRYPAVLDGVDRTMFIALKGRPQSMKVLSNGTSASDFGYPERYSRKASLLPVEQSRSHDGVRPRLKSVLKKWLRP